MMLCAVLRVPESLDGGRRRADSGREDGQGTETDQAGGLGVDEPRGSPG